MKLQIVLVTLAFGLLACIPSLQAYSSGAGSCAGGQAAVGGIHISSSKVIKGTLAQGNYQVLLDSVALKPGIANKVVVGKTHIISIKAGNYKIFRGFLIRVGVKTASALKPVSNSPNVKISNLCSGVGAVGLTHKSNNTKTGISGYLTLTSVGKVPLDVTIVVENRRQTSVYYYTGFTLNVTK